MRKPKRQFDWISWQEYLDAQSCVLLPLREYLAGFFTSINTPPDEGYVRRPLIGLRLEVGDNTIVAIRPGWTPPRKRIINGEVSILKPGKVHPQVITLELLDPRKSLSLRLAEGKTSPGYVKWDMDTNRRNLRLVAETAHALLTDPMMLFSRQADHCCRCGRSLSDLVSRTRGIGPECITQFAYFESPPTMTAVDRYRQQYYSDTGFLPYMPDGYA